MSTGVYILFTSGPEFRVQYGINIEKIYGDFIEGRWKINTEEVKKFFSNAKVFKDRDEAFNHALEISLDIGYLDDGICFIDDFKNIEYPL